MKLFKSIPLLALLSSLSTLSVGATAFAQTNSVRCTNASSDMSPDSFFYIHSDDVGSTVTIGENKYRVVSSGADYHDDIYMQAVTLQDLQRASVQLDIVCF